MLLFAWVKVVFREVPGYIVKARVSDQRQRDVPCDGQSYVGKKSEKGQVVKRCSIKSLTQLHHGRNRKLVDIVLFLSSQCDPSSVQTLAHWFEL